MPRGNLDLIMKMTLVNDLIVTKLDVPAQGARGIPATSTAWRGDTVHIEFTNLRANYSGIYKQSSETINGMWTQSGQSLVLILSKDTTSAKKMQDPKPPFPYASEEVKVENKEAGITLAGTLTYPKGKSKCMAVILITGSGPQDRNEKIMDHKPFWVIADYLSRRGFAVLRCDDRGVGGSGGSMKNSTTLDFASDAEAMLRYLKARKEVDPKRIGMLGHSEGAIVAPIVASRNKDLAFVIMLAGPGLKGIDLSLLQAETLCRQQGMTEAQLQQAHAINQAAYTEALRNASDSKEKIVQILSQAGMDNRNIEVQTSVLLSPWYRTLLSVDPADYLPRVTCPVLALNGKKDVQVPYEQNLSRIDSLLKSNTQHTVKAYDNLNHLFQHCGSCSVDEYGEIPETISPEVLADIAKWMTQLH